MDDKFLEKCLNADYKSIFNKKGYAYFEKGNYNLNIIGIRKNGNDKEKVNNLFDDLLIVKCNIDNRPFMSYYAITTQPGITTIKNLVNAKGCAILVPGQYRGCWKIGLHKGKYEALTQDKPVKVYRDANRDNYYDYNEKSIESGMFGINIHKAGANSKQIDNWSAGCQVFANATQFGYFMNICKKQIENGYGSNFTYTLLTEKDL